MTRSLLPPAARSRGFTLLEMIGVMTIMAVLAGALAPQVFRLIDEGYEAAESKSLRTLAEALGSYVQNSHQIPSTNVAVWTGALAQYAALGPEQVRLNQRNFERRLYADPRFFSTSDSAFPGYTQSVGLANTPTSPRLMLVSNLQGALPANLATGASFEAVWSQTGTPTLVETDTLQIERIHLAGLFNRVLLTNEAPTQAGYRLENGVEGAVAAAGAGVAGSRILWVLSGTRLSLNAAPFPGGASLSQLIVSEQVSASYADRAGTWVWSH